MSSDANGVGSGAPSPEPENYAARLASQCPVDPRKGRRHFSILPLYLSTVKPGSQLILTLKYKATPGDRQMTTSQNTDRNLVVTHDMVDREVIEPEMYTMRYVVKKLSTPELKLGYDALFAAEPACKVSCSTERNTIEVYCAGRIRDDPEVMLENFRIEFGIWRGRQFMAKTSTDNFFVTGSGPVFWADDQ